MSIYCCSDLHGSKELYNKIINFIMPEDTLVILGDLCDRGLAGYEIMEDALKRENVIYLKGNHEDLFVKAAREHIDSKNHSIFWRKAHFENGGKLTFNKWRADGCPKNILNQLDNLEDSAVYTNINNQKIYLTHSGNLQDPLWDRKHFRIKQTIEDNTLYIHGHTPIGIMRDLKFYDKTAKPMAPFVYNDGHKINIDCGTPYTRLIVLLNLDTLKPIIIKEI